MSENTRTVRLDHLLGIYAVGSGDWSWQEEYDKLYERDYQHQLTEQIRANGITEPILLGSDGRVWDGHHRICAAMHLGIDRIPVVWIATPEPEWEYGTTHADDPQAVDMGYSLEGARRRVARWNASDPERKGIVMRAPKRVWEPLPVGGESDGREV